MVPIVAGAMDSKEPDVRHWPHRWSPITAKRAVTQDNFFDGYLGRSVGHSENYDQTNDE
jgi:hypothetical protein